MICRAAVIMPSSTHLRTQRRPPASYSPAWPWRRGRRRSGGPRGCPPGGHGAPPPSRTESRPRNRTGPPPQRRNVWKWKEIYVEASLTDDSTCFMLLIERASRLLSKIWSLGVLWKYSWALCSCLSQKQIKETVSISAAALDVLLRQCLFSVRHHSSFRSVCIGSITMLEK